MFLQYTKQYLEYCEIMEMQPNERDQIIFMAGYNFRGLVESERKMKEKSTLREWVEENWFVRFLFVISVCCILLSVILQIASMLMEV